MFWGQGKVLEMVIADGPTEPTFLYIMEKFLKSKCYLAMNCNRNKIRRKKLAYKLEVGSA